MLIKLALRNIFRQKLRSIITLSTIVFGCVALLFVGGFFEDMYLQMRENYIGTYTGHLQINKKGFAQYGRISPYQYLIENPLQLKNFVTTLPEVKFVTQRIAFSSLINFHETSMSAVFLGVEPEYEKNLDPELALNPREVSNSSHYGSVFLDSGKGLMPGDEFEMVMGRGLGKGVEIQIGQSVVLLSSTIKGSTNALDMQVKGMYFSASKDLDDIMVRIPLKTAQKLLDTQSVQTLVVHLNKSEDAAKFKNKLQDLFRNQKLDLEVKTWRELYDDYDKTIKIFNSFYQVMRMVIGMVVVLGIFNIINMSVLERMVEIGTLRALGMNDMGIGRLFLVEGMMMGMIGGALGIVMGILVISSISIFGITMPPFPGMTFYWISRPSLLMDQLLVTFVYSIFLGAFSALFPAWRASQLQIVSALRAR